MDKTYRRVLPELHFHGRLHERRVRLCEFCGDRIPVLQDYSVYSGDGTGLLIACNGCEKAEGIERE